MKTTYEAKRTCRESADGKTTIWETTYFEPVTRMEEVQRPTAGEIAAHHQFRLGQSDRKVGRPCASANGKYLEGWYAPEQEESPTLTDNQEAIYAKQTA